MTKVKFEPLRENLHVQLYFSRPIFDWLGLPAQFFNMVYSLLGERLNIQPGEFSGVSTNTLGEACAKFNIYGGSTSVSLFANRVAFDFPNLTAQDLPIVHEVMGTIHDGFHSYFPEIEQGKVELQDYAHLDVGELSAVDTILEKYRIAAVDEAFGADIPVLNTPSAKFLVTAKDGAWQSAVTVEKSQLSATAIFALASISIRKMPPNQKYLEKAAFVNEITKRCLAAVNLESANA